MKLTIFFLLLFTMQISASVSMHGQVTLNVQNESIRDVFKEIENQSPYKFFYNEAFADLNKRININVDDKDINATMNELLLMSDMSYKVLDNNLVVIAPRKELQQQEVTGRVTDASTGEGLPGVTIMIRDTAIGTITDTDGNYSISVPDQDAVLVFSFIGFSTFETVVSDRTTIDIRLEPDYLALDEVVVIGYGVTPKANLTGSVSTVDFDEVIGNRPITNASQALGGAMTGLWVSQNSGQPGRDEAMIRVRGWGTLNDASPLILIDGVEGQMSNLNPNDIESVTILKDAASAAIYGSRAANGVILITTKGGAFDEKIGITYSNSFGLQKMGERYDLITNSVEHMELWNESVILEGGDPVFPLELVEAFRTGDDPFLYPNTDWFDEVTQLAPMMEHNLSITSGSENYRNYFSINYLDQEGIWLNTNSTRYGLTFNNETTVTNWLNIGGRVNVTHKTSKSPYQGIGRSIYMLANSRPYEAPYTQDGRFGGPQALHLSGPALGQPIVDSRNPLPDLHNGLTQLTDNFFKANIFSNVKFMEGLELNLQYSGQYNSNLTDRYNEMHHGYTSSGIEVRPLDYPSTINNQRANVEDFYHIFYSTFNFSRNIADAHELGILLGNQIEDREWKNVNAQMSDPPKDGLNQVSAGTSSAVATGNRNHLRMLSYFGRFNYAYESKYLIELNFRADASSRFIEGRRWGYFPSASIGWNLHQEGFLQDSFFDEFKIRASWGKLGNQSVAGYWPYLTTITQTFGTSYNVDNALAPGAAVTTLVDENITWEETTTKNLGLDLRFLNNRLTAEFDYFNKNTSDIIVRLPIPMIFGTVSPPFENIGEMKNNGFEVSLNWRDRTSNGLTYNLGGNLTYVVNEVVTFRKDAPDQTFLIREGYSYRTIYGYTVEGVYQTDEEAAAHMHLSGYKPRAGELRFVDKNGDGRIDYRDRSELGNTIPKYAFGFTGGLSYKGFDLNLLLQGLAGVNSYINNAFTQPLGISGATITTRWRDRWTPTNPSEKTPRIAMGYDTWNRQPSDFWVHDLSWLKLKNIQFGYTLPFFERHIESAYIYINGQNVLTIKSKDYEGFDVERDTFSSGYGSSYPTPRIWSIGLNITL